MASGSFSGTSGGYTLKTDWNSTSNIADNYSTIVCDHYLVCGSGWDLYIGTRENSCSVNSENKNFTSPSISTGGGTTIKLGTTTHTVEHKSNGKKTVEAKSVFKIKAYIANSYVEDIVATGTMKLDDIPRASSVSGGSGNIGSASNISITRASDTFTHTLEYEFGGLSGTIATDVEETYNWTIPTSFYDEIPDSNSGTGTITCKTYSGDTLVGTSSIEFTANVVNSNPTIGTFTYKDSNSNTVAITGNNQRIIRNNGNLLFTVGSATPKNSATISKYEITFNNVVKSRTSSGDLDFGKINLSSNATATLKVIDSRGNTASKNLTIIIDNWVLPTGLITLNRKNNFYSETYLTVDGTYSSLNGKNTMTIQYQYKEASATEYSSLKTISDNTKETIDLDNNYQWNIKVVITDKIGTTTYNLFLDRGMPIAFFDRLLSSVGINCFPTLKQSLEVFGSFLLNNKSIVDLIYPVGSIYMSVDSTNPTTNFGGTWEQITDSNISSIGYIWKRTK